MKNMTTRVCTVLFTTCFLGSVALCAKESPSIAFYKLDTIAQESEDLREEMGKISNKMDPQFADLQKQLQDISMQMQEIRSRKPASQAEMDDARKQFEALAMKADKLQKEGMALENSERAARAKVQQDFEEKLIKAREAVAKEQEWNVVHECSHRTTTVDPDFDVTSEIAKKIHEGYVQEKKELREKEKAEKTKFSKEKKSKKALKVSAEAE